MTNSPEIENIIEQGKKVIVFTNFTDTLNRIVDHFGKKAVKLDGKMSKVARQNSVDQFQENDKIKVLTWCLCIHIIFFIASGLNISVYENTAMYLATIRKIPVR